MANQYSFDVVSEFDFQELRNAVDQVKKELKSRYDFKDVLADVELENEKISLKTDSDFRAEAIRQILIAKVIARKLDPKILDFGKIESIFGGNVKQDVTLVKTLDTESAKLIAKKVREQFKDAKPAILGDSVRVTSKSKDELQTVIQFLRDQEEIKVPLTFKNYR